VGDGTVVWTWKQYYVLVDCDGRIVGSGYDIVEEATTVGRTDIYVRDAENPLYLCRYNEANQCQLESGQIVLTCKSCPRNATRIG